jgi:hypothetical protein
VVGGRRRGRPAGAPVRRRAHGLGVGRATYLLPAGRSINNVCKMALLCLVSVIFLNITTGRVNPR